MSVTFNGGSVYFDPVSGTYKKAVSTSAVDDTSIPLVSDAANSSPSVTVSSDCTDGSDDGKLSFWEKAKSAVTGAAKGLVNGVKDLVTFKNPVKSLLAIGAIALSIACPPAGVALAVAGAVGGVVTTVKGGIRASNATTDAEAKAAWGDIGSGVLQVGLSAVGAKAGLKACGNTTNAIKNLSTTEGFLAKAKSVGQGALDDTTTSIANNASAIKNSTLVKNISESGGKNVVTKTLGGTGKTLVDSVKNIPTTIREIPTNVKAKISSLKESGVQSLADDLEKSYNQLDDVVSKAENLTDDLGNGKTVSGLKDTAGKVKDAETYKAFKKELDAIDKNALPDDVRTSLDSYAKNSQKVNKLYDDFSKDVEAKANKLNEKQDEIMNNYSIKDQNEYMDLCEQVKNGTKTLDDLKANEIRKKVMETAEYKAIENLGSPGSAIKGATYEAKTWTKNSIKNNSDELLDSYNSNVGSKYKIGADDLTEDGIKATQTSIEEAQKTVVSAKKAVSEAKDEATKTAKTSQLETAEKQLAYLESKLSTQKYIYNSNQVAAGEGSFGQTVSAMSPYVTPTIAANGINSDSYDNVVAQEYQQAMAQYYSGDATAATTQTASTAASTSTASANELLLQYEQAMNNCDYSKAIPEINLGYA